MSSEDVIIPMGTVSTKGTKHEHNLDMNTVEMVFGSPNSSSVGQKDSHLIDNEKDHTDKNNRQRNDSDAQPLLERNLPRPLPPLAGPEIDDLDDQKPNDHHPFPDELEPGIAHSTPDLVGDGEGHKFNGVDHEGDDHHLDDGKSEDGKWVIDGKNGFDETDFYYGGGIESRFGEDRPVSPFPSAPGSIPDVNTYQQKKNLAQGMMDLALLSANANQLRYVLESSEGHPYYYFSLVFISLSIIFQILVGIGLIMNSRYNVKDEKDICKADKINNATVLGIFLVTIVNVFITSFSVASPTRTAMSPVAPVAGGG